MGTDWEHCTPKYIERVNEIFFCVEGWRFQILKVLFDCSMFCCGFLLLHQLLLLEVDCTVEFHNAKFGT